MTKEYNGRKGFSNHEKEFLAKQGVARCTHKDEETKESTVWQCRWRKRHGLSCILNFKNEEVFFIKVIFCFI